jgi:hypothetical protein
LREDRSEDAGPQWQTAVEKGKDAGQERVRQGRGEIGRTPAR